jgi:hypothetical protein
VKEVTAQRKTFAGITVAQPRRSTPAASSVAAGRSETIQLALQLRNWLGEMGAAILWFTFTYTDPNTLLASQLLRQIVFGLHRNPKWQFCDVTEKPRRSRVQGGNVARVSRAWVHHRRKSRPVYLPVRAEWYQTSQTSFPLPRRALKEQTETVSHFVVIQYQNGRLEILPLANDCDPVQMARERSAFLVGITATRSRAEFILSHERLKQVGANTQ